MAMDALPTELDNRILAFLGHDSLNAMSKTSKSYRKVTEPFLYRHIKLLTSREVSMRWLVVTMLHRPELAAHIKTIIFSENHRDGAAKTQPMSQPSVLLEQAIGKLHQTIQTMLGSEAGNAEIRVSWMGSLLADEHAEGSLALIVCLAHNLECLNVMGEVREGVIQGYHGHFLTFIMWEVFKHFYSEPKEPAHAAPTPRGSHPFQRLQDFHIKTGSPIQIITLPYLRTIHVEKCDDISVSHLFPMETSHHLHTLEIVDTFCIANSIRDIFSDNHAIELKRLILREFCAVPDQDLGSDGDFSCQPIIDALIENCPELEYLELDLLSWSLAGEREKSLKGFDELTSLSTLKVDLDTLVDSESRNSLLDLDKLLPPNLQALHICRVGEFEFWSLFLPWLESDLTSSITEISITVDFDEDIQDDWASTKGTLFHTATLLWAKKQISLYIYRPARTYEMVPKLLVDREGSHEDESSSEEPEMD